jgi:AbrB family looped-hinge helix DNA binding protein
MSQPASIEAAMNVVTISSKFQVVIPRAVRERLDLRPGQKVRALVYDGHVELIPVRPASALRGFLRGIDTTLVRHADSRGRVR